MFILRGIPKHEKKAMVVEEKEYTRIPDKFTTIDEWPKKCNILCYSCTAPIDGTPLFIPAIIETDCIPKVDNTLYCSPTCACHRINKDFVGNKDAYLRFLRTLILRMTGVYIEVFEAWEDISIMSAYGGNMSSQIYQNRLREMNYEWFEALKNK